MMKSALAILVLCGTVAAADAMPVSVLSASGSLPVTKAAVVVKKTVVRRRAPVVRRKVVVKKKVIVH